MTTSTKEGLSMNRTVLTLITILTLVSTLHISNTFAQETPHTLIQKRDLRTIAFSPDSKTLASLDTRGKRSAMGCLYRKTEKYTLRRIL